MSGNHQPNPSEEQQPGSISEQGQTAASSQGDKTVPLSELVKQRQAASEAKKAAEAAEARIKDLEARLAETEKPKGEARKQTDQRAPEQADTSVESDPRISKLDEILRKDAVRDLRDQRGLTYEQAERVHEIQSRMPELDFDEAYAIAASRHTDVFSEDGRGVQGYDPGVHGASRPGPGSKPPVVNESDWETRIGHYQKLRGVNKGAAQTVWNNMVGSIAAKQLGVQGHTRLKIPNT